MSTSSKPEASEFQHLDLVASKLSRALQKANITHFFIGGYATGLLTGNRITEDIDVVTATNPDKALRRMSNLTKSDKQRIYACCGVTIRVNMLKGGANNSRISFHLPDPEFVKWYRLAPKDRPKRNLETSITIIHPTVLILTKLKPWAMSRQSEHRGLNGGDRNHFRDILYILFWIERNKENIDLAGFPEVPRRDLLRLLAQLYWAKPEARSYLACTLTPEELRDVLNSR